MAAYTPIRPDARSGRGSLTAYRAISRTHHDQVAAIGAAGQIAGEIPMRWVRQQPLFGPLEDRNAAYAAALGANDPAVVGDVHKIWGEIAYEDARAEVAAELPSRLDSIYACPDPIEAFCFLDHSGTARHVWEVLVNDDADWAMVDMAGFSIERPYPVTSEAMEASRAAMLTAGRRYWTPAEIEQPEVLIAGGITYVREVGLRETLIRAGILANE